MAGKELGYKISSADDQEAELNPIKNWTPTELVDGPDDEKIEAISPLDYTHDGPNLPRQFTAPEPEHEKPKVAPKVITNIREELEPATVVRKQSGHTVPQEYEDPPSELEGYDRIDNISGPIPYLHLEEFKHGIFVRPLNPIDLARISRAMQAKSLTSLFDALGYTVNVPYRMLTIMDHYQIMHWHMLNSYPAEPFNMSWRSMYHPNLLVTEVRKTTVTEIRFDMELEEFNEYRNQGLDLPRVYFLDLNETVKDIEIAPVDPAKGESAEKARVKRETDDKENLLYLMKTFQYLDINRKEISSLVSKHRNSPMPRIRALMEYMANQKNLSLIHKARQFGERVQKYGIVETFQATAPEISAKVALESILQYQQEFPYRDKPFASEIDRISAIIAENENAMVQPLREESAVNRTSWSFFPFV